VIPKLLKMGVAKESDSESLTQMCQAWAATQKAWEKVEQDPIQKDARCAYLGYLAQWQKIAQNFGMTPADRARLRAEKTEKPKVRTRKRG